MIGQQADALRVGDASALYAISCSSILVASSAATFESPRVLLEGGAVLFDSCKREVSQWRRRFEVGALDADVGSRAQQLQALLARVQNTTAVHITDLSLGELDNMQQRPPPRSASTVPCAHECALRRSSGASRAMRVAPSSRRCCQQLLAVRAMLASFGDGRADESSDLLLAVCPTLLAMPLLEDFRLQTCARLLTADSPTD
jgi:hypothetical protein